jgi:DNA mismatch repair ATPase MutS
MIGRKIRKRASSSFDEGSIIERSVTAIYSRGTLIDPVMLGDCDYSFCAFLYVGRDGLLEFVLADISLNMYSKSSTFYSTDACISLFYKYNPREVVFLRSQKQYFVILESLYPKTLYSPKNYVSVVDSEDLMCQYFEESLLITAHEKLRRVDILDMTENSVNLSGHLLESLDIISSDPRKLTLWKIFNRTCTFSGRRKLLRWLLTPSTKLDTIAYRQRRVEYLVENPEILGISMS